jgi:predicted O-linked N-acetylglucosamine transferase (SPINDLY family)/GT2 family glycosyltransferase
MIKTNLEVDSFKNDLNFIIMTPGFTPTSGGIIALHNLAKTIKELKIPCKMIDFSKNHLSNDIFDDYGTESDINDFTIVVYPEIIPGNPLNAKNVVRWILCELGIHCAPDIYLTWSNDDFVYHYSTFDPSKNANSYNLLSPLCISSKLRDEGKAREGYCHVIRKGNKFHQSLKYIHPKNSLLLSDELSQDVLIHVFNTKKYFISYDPYSYISSMAALCGCISVVLPLENTNRKQWLESLSTSVILEHYGEKELKGIAYGLDEIEYAESTLLDVKRQQDIFVEYGKNSVKRFLNDMAIAFGKKKIVLDNEKNNFTLNVFDVFFSGKISVCQQNTLFNAGFTEQTNNEKNRERKSELNNFKPLVSICIPTYNGEKFIYEAIQSILAQTYTNLEIILSDDASIDRTIEIAKSLQQESFCKFSILEHSQYGLAQNWNFCISQAQGKYIKFLFQDDLLVPTAIERMVALAEQDPDIGLVFSPRVLFTETGNPHDPTLLANHEAKDVHKAWSNLKSIQSGEELLQDLNLLNNPINKVGEPSTVLIRKDVFDTVGVFNPDFCQLVDLEMWLRIMSQYKVGYIDQFLSKFRIHSQQQTQKNSLSKETILSDYQRFFLTISEDSRYPQATRQEALYRHTALRPQGSSLQHLCKQFAEQLIDFTDNQLANWCQGSASKIYKTLLSSGTKDTSLSEENQVFVNNIVAKLEKGFEEPQAIQNLLAAMLYYRADELPLSHDLFHIPAWLLSDYLQFLFSTPVNFHLSGEADNYVNYIQGWMDYLHTSILSQPDRLFWQDIANKFAQTANFIPAYFNDTNLKNIYKKRANIIEFYLKNNGCEVDYQFDERPRNRKKIRLGIIASHYLPSAETFAALPAYEYLSRDFEVVLYSLQETGDSLEQYCFSCANHHKLLPSGLVEQVDTIRADDLDLLFFATNVTAVTNQMCLLASHRLARIQLTSGGSVVTTGMRHMDYFISGTLTDPSPVAQEQYREELLQLVGAAHCFSYGDNEVRLILSADRQDLGISDDVVVFTSGANFYKVIPELIHTWAKIIAAVPNSVLMLFPFGPNWSSSYPKETFEQHLHNIFAEYGVSADRVIALDPQPVPNREDLKEYYKLADVYLDSYPFAGTTSLIEPLQVNLPVIARQGNSFRSSMGAAMIRSLDITDLVADSEESYIQLAVALGNNPELRQQKSAEVKAKMADNPSFLDSKGYGAKIGELFKELVDRYSRNALSDNLRLKDVNLMMFPDWSQSEESVGLELQQVIQTLATQPDAQKTTLLIDTTNIAIEDAEMFLSSVAMNLMMEEDLDISEELEISLIEDLNNIQWENLSPRINARIVLECDNQAAVGKFSQGTIPQRQIESFILSY